MCHQWTFGKVSSFGCVITHIVAKLPYSIFRFQYTFSASSLTYEMLRWASMMDHYLMMDCSIFPCHDWVSGHLDLRTDVAIWPFTEQSLLPRVAAVGSQWTDVGSDLLFTGIWFSRYYLVLWLLLLLYSFLWHVLAFSVMIWRSYKYVDLDVMILCINVPIQTRKFLIHTHWFYPP